MRIELLSGAAELTPAEWQSLATDGDPFISREFLGAAEQTGAAGENLGWQPMHLVLRDDDRRLAGMLPLYLRTHSFGDFSQDWRWPDAWRQAGLAYYPKLVTGVPFTPSPGPRLLIPKSEIVDHPHPGPFREPASSRNANGKVGSAHPTKGYGEQSDMPGPDPSLSEKEEMPTDALIASVLTVSEQLRASCWQCLFVQEQDRERLDSAGLLMRRGVQFHWINRGYGDFADFLSRFTAEKRKKVKRERRAVSDAGLHVTALHGDEIEPSLWPVIHRHYRDTFARYGNYPAFSEAFFRQVGAGLGWRMVVFIAWRGQQPVASAICYRNSTTLFGRHWGSDVDCPGLHFELCYYSGIEYAIGQGLQRFEPGAQGEHKLARGFEPVPTWSAFWIRDEAMRGVLATYLRREEGGMLGYQEEMADHLPFRAEPASK